MSSEYRYPESASDSSVSRNELSGTLLVPGDGKGGRDFCPAVNLFASDDVWKLSCRNAGCDDNGGASCGSGSINW
jgi:hypothetical protein